MNNASSILLKIAAACMIALGSGFITLVPPLLNYDDAAYESLYKVEAKIGKMHKIDSYNCDIVGENRAACNIAKHKIVTNEASLKLVNALKDLLLTSAILTSTLSLCLKLIQHSDRIYLYIRGTLFINKNKTRNSRMPASAKESHRRIFRRRNINRNCRCKNR